jgi:lysozyme
MTKTKIAGTGFAFFIIVLGVLEGLRTVAYQDIVGVWTICYGHTQNVKPGDTMTVAQCKVQLAEEAAVYWEDVDRMVTVPMRPREQIAFSLLAYNIGLGAFQKSTLLKYANSGNMPAACLQILRWSKQKQLLRRRWIEHDICIGKTVE